MKASKSAGQFFFEFVMDAMVAFGVFGMSALFSFIPAHLLAGHYDLSFVAFVVIWLFLGVIIFSGFVVILGILIGISILEFLKRKDKFEVMRKTFAKFCTDVFEGCRAILKDGK